MAQKLEKMIDSSLVEHGDAADTYYGIYSEEDFKSYRRWCYLKDVCDILKQKYSDAGWDVRWIRIERGQDNLQTGLLNLTFGIFERERLKQKRKKYASK